MAMDYLVQITRHSLHGGSDAHGWFTSANTSQGQRPHAALRLCRSDQRSPQPVPRDCSMTVEGRLVTCAGDMRWIVCPRTRAPASDSRYAT